MAKPKFAPGRIKKMMQEDDEIGRVAAAALPVVGKSIESFARDLITKAAAISEKDEDAKKTLAAAHIKQCVEAEPLFDFLRATVQKAPAAQPPKRARAPSGSGMPKRSKKSAAASGEGTSSDGTVAAQLAVASDYRPLTGDDDDYDAEDD